MTSRRELLSIIVPVYNEVRTVAAVIDRLQAIDLPVPREILIVDDGSTDGTVDVLRTIESRIPDPRSRGTIVAIQDADLELDPQQLAALVTPIVRGETDVVYGSRFLAGRPEAPWITIAANRGLTAMTNVLFGSSITDMETCYKIMRTDVARSLALDANRFDIEPQITARLLRGGHRIHEVPVKFDPRSRAQGKKIGWRDGVRAIEVLVKERFRR
ncbi:MAG: glycosyl transferase [Acidobacteria bacterium]|nr:MAG: glycosyl transferase [Acidobacteriota bacterium]